MSVFAVLWLFGAGLSLLDAPEPLRRLGLFVCGVASGALLVQARLNKEKGL